MTTGSFYGKNAERTSGTAPAFSRTDIWGTNLNIAWNFTDSLTLKSITAWRDLDSEFARDGDHSQHRISQFYDDLRQQQFTQELQLLGESFQRPVALDRRPLLFHRGWQ